MFWEHKQRADIAVNHLLCNLYFGGVATVIIRGLWIALMEAGKPQNLLLFVLND